MTISRREFMAGGCAAAAGLPLLRVAAGRVADDRPLIVSTWPFALGGNERAREVIQAGGSALDGVEQGIRVVESIGNGSVGLSGGPNAAGYVQQDACIMNGPGHQAGSVAAIEGIVHPISAARRVMEHTKHVMLVGEGARWFAMEHDVESVDIADHEALKRAWVEGERKKDVDREGHDTIALLVLDAEGHIAGGCSTSGAGGKLPGRVGDSPILGAALYVDDEVGAAGATGLGENVMRYCASFLIVELKRQGMHPQQACEEVVHRIARLDPRGYELSICFIALDKHGRYGAAASNQTFPFRVGTVDGIEELSVKRVTPR